ncbi:hypothetical protein [Streptomyces sp. NBC_00500]|uniref:hypothetical protein n=1 Tax=unclassified Streptomyces TaxID=2593676 RepID=UPI00386556A1
MEDGSAAAGEAVCRQTCDGGASRVWKPSAVDDASWTLEVMAGAAAVRARIRARSSNLPTGQRWRARSPAPRPFHEMSRDKPDDTMKTSSRLTENAPVNKRDALPMWVGVRTA